MKFGLTTSRWTAVLWLSLALSGPTVCRAQEQEELAVLLPDAPTPQNPDPNDPESGQASLSAAGHEASSHKSPRAWISGLTTQWLRGSAVTPDQALSPLTNDERFRIYWQQTYFHAGTYAKRLAGAGIDQARGVPDAWGGGFRGYEKRFASRFGQFAVQNTVKTAGDAAFGYEPRYDLCRCEGFWPRTKHAIIRNFVTYNSTERELRPQIPLYGAAFFAGMTSAAWKPGPRNVWAEGGYGAAQQAGWGILSNWLSEFSGDIGRKITRKH